MADPLRLNTVQQCAGDQYTLSNCHNIIYRLYDPKKSKLSCFKHVLTVGHFTARQGHSIHAMNISSILEFIQVTFHDHRSLFGSYEDFFSVRHSSVLNLSLAAPLYFSLSHHIFYGDMRFHAWSGEKQVLLVTPIWSRDLAGNPLAAWELFNPLEWRLPHTPLSGKKKWLSLQA